MLEPKRHSSPNFERLNVAVRASGSAFSTFSEMTAVFQSWLQTRRLCVIIVDAVIQTGDFEFVGRSSSASQHI